MLLDETVLKHVLGRSVSAAHQWHRLASLLLLGVVGETLLAGGLLVRSGWVGFGLRSVGSELDEVVGWGGGVLFVKMETGMVKEIVIHRTSDPGDACVHCGARRLDNHTASITGSQVLLT